ncbi:lactoylglutathione lyase [Clostridium algifaecis]|uniref:Aldoketomutase n=1 Tax=Clostridium algifaecis TaxID=1472040 RepID=A0ABS4KPR5_9CLOT|nr:VOC family protein [Clostridium algifaecis]MBP2031371.1 lactoylglutathione lyase [Clostridium algifaecis]
MKFKFDHNNINVLNLEKSIEFYEKALGFKEIDRKYADDNSFILVYMGDGQSNYSVELTWLKDRKEPYNLGDNEIHMAVRTDDYDAAHKLHKDMGCICYENEKMGLYFIADPDGYWTEILPRK